MIRNDGHRGKFKLGSRQCDRTATDSSGHFFIKRAKKRYSQWLIGSNFGLPACPQVSDIKLFSTHFDKPRRGLRGIFATWPQNEIPKALPAFQIVSDQGKFLLQRKGVVLLGLWRNQAGDLGGLPAAQNAPNGKQSSRNGNTGG
jgi:hypothetical protein